jgi:hypothetical protein
MIGRKRPGIRQEALGLCSPPIDAEGVHFEHANAADTGCEMLLSLAPGVESGRIQICIPFFGEQAIQGLESVRRGVELPP